MTAPLLSHSPFSFPPTFLTALNPPSPIFSPHNPLRSAAPLSLPSLPATSGNTLGSAANKSVSWMHRESLGLRALAKGSPPGLARPALSWLVRGGGVDGEEVEES